MNSDVKGVIVEGQVSGGQAGWLPKVKQREVVGGCDRGGDRWRSSVPGVVAGSAMMVAEGNRGGGRR